MTGGMWAYLIVLCFLFTVSFLAARSITKDIKRRDAEEQHRIEEGTTLNIEVPPKAYRELKKASDLYGTPVDQFVLQSAIDKATGMHLFFNSQSFAPPKNTIESNCMTVVNVPTVQTFKEK